MGILVFLFSEQDEMYFYGGSGMNTEPEDRL